VKQTTIERPLLDGGPHATMEVLLEAVFSVWSASRLYHATDLLHPSPATGDESHSDSTVAPKSRRSVPKLTRTKEHTATEQHDTTHPQKEHSSNPAVDRNS
jgi:hypothetical protein